MRGERVLALDRQGIYPTRKGHLLTFPHAAGFLPYWPAARAFFPSLISSRSRIFHYPFPRPWVMCLVPLLLSVSPEFVLVSVFKAERAAEYGCTRAIGFARSKAVKHATTSHALGVVDHRDTRPGVR